MKCNNRFPKYLFIIIPVALVILICFLCFRPKGISEQKTVAYVNGLPISYGEYMLIAGEKRGEIAAYFYETYPVDEDVNFWSEDAVFDGEIPLELLKTSILDTLTRIKLEQQLMIEYGLVKKDDIAWKSFLKLYEEENKRRQMAVAQGEGIYGPEQYTENGYYHYLHENRLQQLREAMYAASGSEDISDKFTDTLIDEQLENMRKVTEVKTVSGIYEDIEAIPED